MIDFLTYVYPNEVKIKIGKRAYTYVSSEYCCRHFIERLKHGARFKALNWFKPLAKLIKKEEF